MSLEIIWAGKKSAGRGRYFVAGVFYDQSQGLYYKFWGNKTTINTSSLASDGYFSNGRVLITSAIRHYSDKLKYKKLEENSLTYNTIQTEIESIFIVKKLKNV